MSDRFPDNLFQAADANGKPLSGAKLNFYQTLTVIRKDTFSDSAKTSANANPVVADSAGRFGPIFMLTDEGYKVVYTDAADVEIATLDPVFPVLQPGTFPVLAVSNKSTNYTVLTTDRGGVIRVDGSSGPVTITLLPVAAALSGFVLQVKKVDSSANVVTIDGNLAETIDGLTTVGLGLNNDALDLVCNGTSWDIKGEKRLPTPAPAIADQNVVVNAAGTGFTTTTQSLPRAYLAGLGLSNGTDAVNDINIAVGEARDDANTANLAVATAIGKQIDVSWASGGTTGTPTGGLSSSLTLTDDTWYHVILGLVAGVAEVGFDTSITGANLVTDHSFTNTRRIGSVRRATATNLAFLQIGDDFILDVPVQDISQANPGTAATLRTLTVPLGIRVKANIAVGVADNTTGGSTTVLITPPDITDTTPSSLAFHLPGQIGTVTSWQFGSQVGCFTNTSSQVRSRLSGSAADITLLIVTHGWKDRRGRDS